MLKKVRTREISPFAKDFKMHIEKGIWPIVNELNNKGYITVDSCQGHILDGDSPHVAFALLDPAMYSDVYCKLNTIGTNIQLLPKWFQGKQEDAVTKSLFANIDPWYVWITFNPFLFCITKKVVVNKIKRLPAQLMESSL